MKSNTQKVAEAVERLKNSSWENSKAKRLGTRNQDQWEAWKEKEINRLS